MSAEDLMGVTLGFADPAQLVQAVLLAGMEPQFVAGDGPMQMTVEADHCTGHLIFGHQAEIGPGTTRMGRKIFRETHLADG